MPSNPVSPKIASTDTGASLRTSHFNSRDTNVPISPSSNDVCVGTLDSSSDPRDEPRTPLKKPPTWYASDSFPGTPQPASNFSSPGNKVRSGFASSRDSPSGAKCLKHGFSDSSEEDTPDVHSRRTSRSSSYSNRQSCRPSELKSIRSGSHNLPTTSRDQPQQQRNLAQFSSTKQHRADSIDSEVICPPPRSPSPLATKFSSTKASMASIFRKPSRQRLDPDEMGSGMLSPSVTTPSRISSVFGRRPTMDGIDNDSTAQRGRGRSLSRSSKAVRSQSMPVDISRSRSTADREMNFEFSELNYRHESIAGRVLQLFRDFDKSNVVPEYLKRRIPRYACFVVPHIHQIEAKLDEWTWLVNFCENWGLSPLGLIMGVFLLTAMHRVYRRNARYISSYVGFVYPLYRTIVTFLQPAPAELSIFQAPKSINMSKYEYEVAKWKAYWPIYGSILVLDEFSSVLLRIYPFYFTTRTVFCYWLYHNNGAAYLFYKYIEPLWQSGVAAMTAVDDVVSATGLTAFDYMKETTPVSAEIAKQRLIRIWYKTTAEMRMLESRRNVLKSICLTRDHIIASKDERNLREDIEKAEDKLALLAEAQKRYRRHINWFVDENGLPEIAANQTKINAQIRIKIDKIILSTAPDIVSTKSKLDVFAVITVNDFPRATTSPLTSKIVDETFEIPVDKLSNNVEIQVYQVSLLGNHQLIGITWFSVGELKEELLDKYFAIFPVDVPDLVLTLEPFGTITLKVSLVESTRVKQNLLNDDITMDLQDEDIYLMDDIRKVYTKNGHQFQIFKAVPSLASDMIGARCSVCEESMIGGIRCYCQRCAFVCHTRCFKGVLTKCINNEDILKAPTGTDLNTGQLLEYNKPHSFEKCSINLLRSWCTHCGTKVHVGEKLVQCNQCGKCAHDKCKALVPNFCGLTLAEAGAIAIKAEFDDKKKISKALGFGRT